MNALVSKGRLLLLSVAAVCVFSSATPAAAEATPIIWNQRASTTCLSWFMGYEKGGYCYDRMPNGTKFRMYCWADAKYSYTGNYTSRRWFRGQSYQNGAWGWVHSSYVYYQVAVPRC
jgi:hypothetical protein